MDVCQGLGRRLLTLHPIFWLCHVVTPARAPFLWGWGKGIPCCLLWGKLLCSVSLCALGIAAGPSGL